MAAAEWLRQQPHRRVSLFVRDEARPDSRVWKTLGEAADYVVIGDLGEPGIPFAACEC